MPKEFWTITEIVEQFQINEGFISELEKEEIICTVCPHDRTEKLLSPDDLEKLRLARILSEEMEVNLPGIEVILRMRHNMLEMRRQFDAILEDMARQFREILEQGS